MLECTGVLLSTNVLMARLPTISERKLLASWLLSVFGQIQFERGNAAEAVEYFRRAVGLDPGNAEVQMNLGSAYFSLERLEDAAQAYRAAIEANPGLLEARANYAQLLLRQGNQAEAEEQLQKIAKQDPEHPMVQNFKV